MVDNRPEINHRSRMLTLTLDFPMYAETGTGEEKLFVLTDHGKNVDWIINASFFLPSQCKIWTRSWRRQRLWALLKSFARNTSRMRQMFRYSRSRCQT